MLHSSVKFLGCSLLSLSHTLSFMFGISLSLTLSFVNTVLCLYPQCSTSFLHDTVCMLPSARVHPMKTREEVVTTMSQQPLSSRWPPCTVCLFGGFPGCALQPQLHNGATWELLKTPVPRLHPGPIKSKSWRLGISYEDFLKS